MPRAANAKTKTDVAPARTCAYAVVRRVFEQGAYADRALHAQAAELGPRDRALAMRLAYGTVQRKGTLDHLIEALAARPASKLDAPLLAACRLGLFELLYMQGAPAYAVVADSVQLAKLNARAGHGLVNAVLRRAQREGVEALLGALSDDTPTTAAIKHSHPEWIARLLWDELGAQEARALMAVDNEPGEVALRANTLVTDTSALAAGLPAASHVDSQLAEALVLDEPLDLHATDFWKRGACIAQARAAMLVGRVLDPQPGERVLDLCAAPGGKATHLAALMGDEGEVVAVERDVRRARALASTAARLRAGSVKVRVADARERRVEDAGGFDRVLVDPPCSGLGTLQAHPDLRWRMTPEAVEEMARAQGEILAAGAQAVRPGGVLVYSTCTISPSENEHLIAAFLDSQPDFALDPQPRDLPTMGQRGARLIAPADTTGQRLTLPQHDHSAGFYIARMRRG